MAAIQPASSYSQQLALTTCHAHRLACL